MAKSPGLLKGRWTVWILALVFSFLAAFGVFLIVGKASERVPYYIAKQDLAARTPITLGNTEQVDVNADAKPPTAISKEQIQSGNFFAQVPLKKGDIITSAVAGSLQRITYKLPPGYVAASIQVAPERAVAGKVKTGDYIDIAAVDSNTAKVVMQHILVLDVTVNPSSIAEAANSGGVDNSPTSNTAPGPDSQQVRSGIPQVYTLALKPEDYVKLALLKSDQILLALSQTPPVPMVDQSITKSQMFAPGPVVDGGTGTGNALSTPTPNASPSNNGGFTDVTPSASATNASPTSTPSR